MNRALGERAIQRLNEAAKYSKDDPEAGHVNADAALCELLKELGFADVVRAWEKVTKWYS